MIARARARVDPRLAPLIREVDPIRESSRWDAFVRSRPDATFYHLSAWREVLGNTYGFEPRYLAAEDGTGRIVGVLPLFLVRRHLFGSKLLSLPFSDVAGPLASSVGVARALIEAASRLRREVGARSLQVRMADRTVLGSDLGLVEDCRYDEYRLPLDRDSASIWKRPELAKARNQTRRAVRAGVSVFRGRTAADLRSFYELHLRTTKMHGLPAQPFSFFQSLVKTLSADAEVRLFLGARESRIVSSGLFVVMGSTSYFVYNASDPEARWASPSYPIVWEAIQAAGAAGCSCLSFGKTSRTNLGLTRFKRQWGAEPHPLHYLYFPNVAGLTSSSYREDRLVHRGVTSLWRALPAAVTNWLGQSIYRYMA